MNIHHQPFYQEDFSQSYNNNNCYYDQPPQSYHAHGGSFNAINANISNNNNCAANNLNQSPVLVVPPLLEDPTSCYQPQPTYWTPDEDEKSLSSTSSSITESLNGAFPCYSNDGGPPDELISNNNNSSSRNKVNSCSKNKGPGPHPPSKRKGVGGRRKSEKPPSPVVLKKRRLAANAR
jgi:hypothetical protein